MWKSGIDSLIHGIFHLNKFHSEREIKDLRLALISIDNAIELLLKKCLDDNGIDIMGNSYKTKSILDNLREIRTLIRNAPLTDEKKKKLEPFVNQYKIRTFRKDRNDAFHEGSIRNEAQLVELTNDVLKSVQSFLKVFYNEDIEPLDSYFSRTTLVVYQLETEYNQIIKKRGQITDKQYLQQSYELIRTIIIHCSDQLIGKKDNYSNVDLETAIDKMKQMKEFEFTFLKDMALTIKKKFIHVRDIYEFSTTKLPLDDENIKKTFVDLNSLFSFFLEIYRLLEMGYLKKI